VLIFGESEIRFLERLDDAARAHNLRRLFGRDFPCILITQGLDGPVELLAEAERAGVPLLRTAVATPIAIARLTTLLEDQMAPREIRHGVLLDIVGLGVLVTGESGIGKSECALDLVGRGHRLVADDTVEIRCRGEAILIGTCPELTRHHVEIRGLGLINVTDLFGVSSTRSSKRVELVVHLERWDETREYDRLGLDVSTIEILGISVPLVVMPVAPAGTLPCWWKSRRGISCCGSEGVTLPANWPSASSGAGTTRRSRRRRRDWRRQAICERVQAPIRRRDGLSGAGKSHALRALEDLGYLLRR
jgi:HPr kinase/phosphorylase